MANDWGIPEWLEKKLIKSIKNCVYCQVELKEYPHVKGTPGDKATWEHLDNDGPSSEDNVVRCCAACNSSKGTKALCVWFESDYCKKKGINQKSIKNRQVSTFLQKNCP